MSSASLFPNVFGAVRLPRGALKETAPLVGGIGNSSTQLSGTFNLTSTVTEHKEVGSVECSTDSEYADNDCTQTQTEQISGDLLTQSNTQTQELFSMANLESYHIEAGSSGVFKPSEPLTARLERHKSLETTVGKAHADQKLPHLSSPKRRMLTSPTGTRECLALELCVCVKSCAGCPAFDLFALARRRSEPLFVNGSVSVAD